MEYQSSSQNTFNAIRTTLLLFVGSAALLITFQIKYCLAIAFAITLVTLLIMIASNYSKVSRQENTLVYSTFKKAIQIDQIQNIETWWNYNFNPEVEDYSDPDQHKTRMTSNIINVYAEITGLKDSIVLYEEIYLSDKFPNNHTYDGERYPDPEKAFKIWDVDNCINTLNLKVFQERISAKN
ncbi:MAG: hypothetical protein AAGK97_10755 [Bacteroidota bacterium]